MCCSAPPDKATASSVWVHDETARRAGADRAAGARRGGARRAAVQDRQPRLSHHLEAFRVYGPCHARVRGLRGVAEAGAELILVSDEAEQMERLVAEVMPSSRDSLPRDQRFCPLTSGEEGYGGRFYVLIARLID